MLPSSPPKDKKDTPLDWLKQAFFYGIKQVNGKHCVIQHLKANPPCPENESIYVIAIGKAAESMAAGAAEVYAIRKGLVITAPVYHDDNTLPSKFVWVEGSHPIPDHRSLAAGEALFTFIGEIPPQAPLLLLISGGSSAMVEQLPRGLSIDSLKKINRWLLQSGLNIQCINTLRKHLSEIKGGKLARALTHLHTHCLIISDVTGDDPAHIASGMAYPLTPQPLPHNLPDWLYDSLHYATPLPQVNDICFSRIKTHIVAKNLHARQAVRNFAKQANISTTVHPHLLTDDMHITANVITKTLKESTPGLHIWGGEPTVKLPKKPGIGGRNQALALAVAKNIAGEQGTYFLSAGTDGIDGNSAAAGASISGETIEQAKKLGLHAQTYLDTANSSAFFEKIGGSIVCSATGTNVMDLMLGLKL